jgi:hypothetical protein
MSIYNFMSVGLEASLAAEYFCTLHRTGRMAHVLPIQDNCCSGVI